MAEQAEEGRLNQVVGSDMPSLLCTAEKNGLSFKSQILSTKWKIDEIKGKITCENIMLLNFDISLF